MLFTAGHLDKHIYKSVETDADCVVLDLEDAVPPNMKDEARNKIRDVLENGTFDRKPVMVRINPMDTGLTLLDLDVVACEKLNGFIFPKAYTADDIKSFDAQLSLKEKTLGLPDGHFEVVILIETAQAVLHAFDMAVATKRTIGLLFGSEDYLADTKGLHDENALSLHVPRNLVVLAARAARVIPIDTPFVEVHDMEGYARHLRQGRNLGFEGILIMSPRQIEGANDIYSPGDEEVEVAREIVRLADQARAEGRGIAMYNGTFISPPTEKQARVILDFHESFKAYLKFCGKKKER